MSDEQNEQPTCEHCIYDNECSWASPMAHWSDCGVWGEWEQHEECNGNGCDDCRDGYIQTSNNKKGATS